MRQKRYNLLDCVMEEIMNFSEKIKRIRTKCFLSQYGFADALGISVTTVNRWETGKAKPNYKTMKLIDEFCKTNSIDFDITSSLMEEE